MPDTLRLRKNHRKFLIRRQSKTVKYVVTFTMIVYLTVQLARRNFLLKNSSAFFFFSHCYVWFHWYNVDFVSICKYRTYLNIIEFMLKPLLLGHTSPDGCKNLYFEFCLSKWPRNLKGVLLWTVNSRKCDCLRKAEMIPGIRQYTFSFLVPVWETWNVRH